MPLQRRADRDRALPHRRLPAVRATRQLDLAEDQVDQAVEEICLAGDVVVQRHRLDTDGLAELAHAQRLDAVRVGKVERGPEDPLAGQRGP